MALFAPIIAGVLIGILAQSMKGRSGFVWGLLTAGLGYGLWYVLRSAVLSEDPLRLTDPTFRLVIYVAGAIAAAAIMLVVVLTLPRRRPAGAEAAGDAAEERVPCPHCSEQILPTARVCRFCGRDVAPAAGPATLADPDFRHYLG